MCDIKFKFKLELQKIEIQTNTNTIVHRARSDLPELY